MKKNLLTKMVALTLAVVTALTPVNAEAAKKKVVTRKDWRAVRSALADEVMKALEDDWYADEDELVMEEHKKSYAYIKSLNGCYQKDGRKIYCLLNDAKKTLKKTGKYSIVAGGVSAKKDQGRVVFKAPKSGPYKFVMTTKNNVVGGDIAVACYSDRGYKWCKRTYKHSHLKKCKGTYKHVRETTTKPQCGFALIDDPNIEGPAATYSCGTVFDSNGGYVSTMKKIYFTTKLKKGQRVELDVRSSGASMDEPKECAYNFCGMDLNITRIK